MFDKSVINRALDSCRGAVLANIRDYVDRQREVPGAYGPLYDLLSDYPFRTGKMLRPCLCIAMARAAGGLADCALISATALELYHNAFLIHDDVEDGSESRRGKGTLHRLVGLARAVNAGDATNVLSVGLLLENLNVVGVAHTLDVLHEIEFMARQSVEGQAMELDWVHSAPARLNDENYFEMCAKKTCWYSFITPCRLGMIVGSGAHHATEMESRLERVTEFGLTLGIAFQIQDDLLNLLGDASYGKEILGDIYEGKRTIMLNHVLVESDHAARILEISRKPRAEKTHEDVEFVFEEMKRVGSIEHARALARRNADRAEALLASMDFLQSQTPLRASEAWAEAQVDRRFVQELVNYVISRNV